MKLEDNLIVVIVAVLASPLSVAVFNKFSTNRGIDKLIRDMEGTNERLDKHIGKFDNYVRNQSLYELEKQINKMMDVEKYTPSVLNEYYTAQQVVTNYEVVIPESTRLRINAVDKKIRESIK